MREQLHKKMAFVPRLVAITGGSGAGKSRLAALLKRAFGKEALVISLDDFYRDRSHLSSSRRNAINFDHPNAIDWKEVRRVLTACQNGEAVTLPSYDFVTHTRRPRRTTLSPKPLIIFEGLWLLRARWLRNTFDLGIYVDCSESLRRKRRLRRDCMKRGRIRESVEQQFLECVSPMHNVHVAPQRGYADVLVLSPWSKSQLENLITKITAILKTTYVAK